MAFEWAKLSHCDRKQVGALIVKDNMIISDGYNGTPSGFENNCELENGETKWYVLHAEANAIRLANKNDLKGKSIAMFCTGGIRCEKSTKYLLKDGVKNVYHLKGGILNYLKSQNKKNSLWEGECFVFDQRVSVDKDLNKGKSILCYACRVPLKSKDLINPKYEEGVSCPQCYNYTNDTRKNNFRERQKQIRLAFERGEKHLKYF